MFLFVICYFYFVYIYIVFYCHIIYLSIQFLYLPNNAMLLCKRRYSNYQVIEHIFIQMRDSCALLRIPQQILICLNKIKYIGEI